MYTKLKLAPEKLTDISGLLPRGFIAVKFEGAKQQSRKRILSVDKSCLAVCFSIWVWGQIFLSKTGSNFFEGTCTGDHNS